MVAKITAKKQQIQKKLSTFYHLGLDQGNKLKSHIIKILCFPHHCNDNVETTLKSFLGIEKCC